MIIREAVQDDLFEIAKIYNQSIEEHVANLETKKKSMADMEQWYHEHGGRYIVLVASCEWEVVGWASINRFDGK